VDLRYKELHWLLGRSSPLSINNKLLLYKTVIAPIWTYALELWGCASKSNIAVIQKFQSKLLRAIVNAPWYITNAVIHSDLDIPTVQVSSTKEATSTEPNYNLIQTHSYNPYQGTISHED
jgi:hypothetical protein